MPERTSRTAPTGAFALVLTFALGIPAYAQEVGIPRPPVASIQEGVAEAPRTLTAPDPSSGEVFAPVEFFPDDLTRRPTKKQANWGMRTPPMFGGTFGGTGTSVHQTISESYQFHARAILLNGNFGDPNSLLAFEADGQGFPNDLETLGIGVDTTGDGLADLFMLAEPVAPTDVPVSPGPNYVFDGGTAVYTNSPVFTSADDGAFQDAQFWFVSYSFSDGDTFTIVSPTGDSLVPRTKVASNNSILPRNRVFFDYGMFAAANLVPGRSHDVSQFTPGFETTVGLGDGFSVEARFPFAATLASEYTLEDSVGTSDAAFGNIPLVLKWLLTHGEAGALSGGLMVTLPTAKGYRVVRPGGETFFRVDNQAVHLVPYLAGLWTPADRLYVQSFLQFDFDTNGNTISGDASGAQPNAIGRFQDQTYFSWDTALGYWLIRDDPSRGILTGAVLAGEFRYSRSLSDRDYVSTDNFYLGYGDSTSEQIEVGGGLHFWLGASTVGSIGYFAPLGSEAIHDGQLSVLLNRMF